MTKTDSYVTATTLKKRTAYWLERVAPFNRRQSLRPGHSALLVIDMQRYFVDPSGAAFLPSAQAILANVQRLIRVFRRERRPVIYTEHVHRADGLDAGILSDWWDDLIIEGTRDSEIDPAIAPRQSDKVVVKHRYSAFYGTDLETVLRVREIKDVVICGVMTNLCCESTARDAFYRDYRTFFLADATGTQSEEMHAASLLNLAYGFAVVTTTDAVISRYR